MSPRTEVVVPYVEDRRNALVLQTTALEIGADRHRQAVSAGLRAALKHAIQVRFNLEDSELAAEPLPSRSDPRLLLFYEASEGGAGVLRRLIDDVDALSEVARTALELCHFDPDTGEDLRRAPGGAEDCVAACYDCLMSYSNQPDHQVLDRFLILEHLIALADAKVEASPGPLSPVEHRARLDRLCESDLETDFLDLLDAGGYRLPDEAGTLITDARTKPDFIYREQCVAVYVDGGPHRYADRALRDCQQQSALEDLGWTVLRFVDKDDWSTLIAAHPGTFGTGR